MTEQQPIQIVYDGQCPFCSAYVRMFRLHELSDVELINAREGHPLVETIAERGLDLDEGMVMKLGEEYYFGEDVVHRLFAQMGDTPPGESVVLGTFRSLLNGHRPH